jgi:DNA-binding beta-propeller fold protein YncE
MAFALATGCGGGVVYQQAPTRISSNAPTGATSPSAGPPVALPNPFTIIATYSASSLGLQQPFGLAIGPNGDLYVTDFAQQTVTMISAEGRVLRRWGKQGHGEGDLSFQTDVYGNPHASIAVGTDGKVYVADNGNSRVDVFSSTGSFIRQFGSSGTGRDQFLGIQDLAVDRGGNAYVADNEAYLKKFSAAGRFEWEIGLPNTDLLGCCHVASVDSHGRVVAALDAGSPGPGRIMYLDGDGHPVDVFGQRGDFPGGTCGVTVDDLGNTFVASCEGGNLQVFDRAHKLIAAWYDNPFMLQTSPRFGPDGEVFTLGADGSVLQLKVVLPNG